MRSHDLQSVIFHDHKVVIGIHYNSVCAHEMSYVGLFLITHQFEKRSLILVSQYCDAILSWLL